MKQNIRVKRSYYYNNKCMISQKPCWKGGSFCEQCETVLNYKPSSQKQNEQKRFVKNCDPCFMLSELGFKACEMCKGSKEKTLNAIDEAQKREESNTPIILQSSKVEMVTNKKRENELDIQFKEEKIVSNFKIVEECKKENFITKIIKKFLK